MASPTPAREQRCPICDRRFKKLEHLLRHRRSHTGEKPFGCKFCKRVYSRSDVLARHIRDHHINEGHGEAPQSNNSVTPTPEGECTDAQPAAGSDQPIYSVLELNHHHHTGREDVLSHLLNPRHDDLSGAAGAQDFNEFNLPTWYDALAGCLAPAASQGNGTAFYAWDMNLTPASIEPLYANHIDLVQRAWPRKRISPVVCVNQRMWLDAAQYPFHNLFSTDVESSTPTSELPSTSKWNLDSDCRKRIMIECRFFLLPAENYSGRATVPGSPRITAENEHEVAIEGLSPQEPTSDFPSTEVLDSSIDFYFRRFHPHYPFIHPATFDARRIKSPLLLAVCLVGISILKPPGTDGFMRMYLPKFIRYCRLDLTYKGLGKGGTHQLLTSLACSLLILYLGLACKSFVDEHQAHMLAIQTLFIADRHGMFSAHEAPPISIDLFAQHTDQELSWTSWARVESLKRLITSLVSIDAAYTRYLDLAANIGLTKVELYLPCDNILFNAPTASLFHAEVNAGCAMLTPRADLSAICSNMLHDLNDYIVLILFDFLTLKEAAARHRLMPKAVQQANSSSLVPFVVYQSDEQAKQICEILTSLSVVHPRTLNEVNPGIIMAWNRLSLHLLVDIDRMQNACGRSGPEAARNARDDLALWCGTASGRRAVLHSSQLFRLLSHYRIGDNKAFFLDHVLFLAAIVVGTFFLLSCKIDRAEANIPIELLNDIDWDAVGSTGFDVNDAVPYYVYPRREAAEQGTSPVKKFIIESGPLTFGGEKFEYSAHYARKIVLLFAQLLEEISLPEKSEYSHLLRTIGDFFINSV